MKDRQARPVTEMGLDELRSVVSQAEELGVTSIVILGGEPLLRWEEILALARQFPNILFPLFTNGLLIDEKMAVELAGCSNIVPFISFEGFRDETDRRRGKGVYDRLLGVCAILDARKPFFGCSVTVTRENAGTVLGEPFIRTMIGTGARAIAYIQYVPTQPGTEHLVPSPEQRRVLNESMPELSRKFPAVFIPAPGDVEVFGGCLAAGRGFIHVTSSGDLEPCAMVPYSDANLRTVPLEKALRSPFLAAIRENHHRIKPDGHCTLRINREWVEGMLSGSKAKDEKDPDRNMT
jgi:MoaA/NifB/PqqE/SkfB family radical SAM enzyme